MSQARIYIPSKTSMQSGKAKTKFWVLEFCANDCKFKDPLMGWTSTTDTTSQVRLKFQTLALAIGYAQRHGLSFMVEPEHIRKIQKRSYSDNFRYDAVAR